MASPRIEDAIEPCVNDVVHLLRNYEDSLREILYEGVEAAETQSAERAGQLTEFEESKTVKACGDDRMRVEEAQSRYLSALAVEHDSWFKRESDLADAHRASRKFELEVATKHLEDTGQTTLREALSERCDQHLALLTPGVESGAENRFVQAEKARQEWTTEVCKAVIMEMRKEWRTGQRKVLQQLAGELRAERKAAADALERQITISKKVSDALRGMWAYEIQQAQDELDQVAEAYKRAVKMALEAKLREARQHAKEQAEFFQKEIREALLFEAKERDGSQAQLRRMKLAMLKWRFDYLADAKRKAAELVARAVLAKLSAAGVSASDSMVQEMEEKKEARKQVKREALAAARAKGMPDPVSTKQDGDGGKKGKAVSDKMKKREGGAFSASPRIEREGTKVTLSDTEEVIPREGDAEEDDEDSVSSSEVSSIDVPTDWIPDQDLGDCRAVLNTVWSRLHNGDEEARDFLFRLEDMLPYEEEILILYEEELMRHGVVCALDATDGRAEEALQDEREAAAQKAAQREEVEVQSVQKPKKKNAKPAVPTVKRRAKLAANGD